jgi:hypothetical protein
MDDDDDPGITTSDIAHVDETNEEDRRFIHGSEARYGRRSDAERARIEHRPTSFEDYDDARMELLSGFPVAIRQVLRDRNHYALGLMRHIKDAAFAVLRLPGAKAAPVQLGQRERRILEEMWHFWAGLSPADRDQLEEFFLAAAREHPPASNYLVLALTRTTKGMQRAARQDWQMPTEMRAVRPPAE